MPAEVIRRWPDEIATVATPGPRLIVAFATVTLTLPPDFSTVNVPVTDWPATVSAAPVLVSRR